MTILIKGMEMPSACDECCFCDNDGMCVILGDDLFDYLSEEVAEHIRYFPDDWKCDACPLIEVPTPHGRLIDADELIVDIMDRGVEGIQTDDLHEIQQTIMDAPTVIEAEEVNND